MGTQCEEILGEIRQLTSQYRQEIPGGRKAWPEAIKSRVRLLGGLGLRAPAIAQAADISYYTVLGWLRAECRHPHKRRKTVDQQSAGHFMPVRVQSSAKGVSTVTVTNREAMASKRSTPTATVTVTLPNGLRVDGVTVEFLNSWLGRQS